jgi:glycosyltransferase involved in cell wall biosynthesis
MKLVIQNTAHVWGGNEKMLATVATGLSKRGHDIVISCAGGAVRERLREMGHRVSHFRPRGSIDAVSGLSFAAWLAGERPDALLLTSWHSISWSAFAAKTARVRKVVMRQGIVRSAPQSGPRKYAVDHWVSDVIVNAPEIRDEWIRTDPVFPPNRVHVVLNGIALPAVSREEMKKRLRSELGVDDDSILVGAAGIVTQRKGFDLLMKAVAAADLHDVHVVIIGDGPYRKNLESLASELGIAPRVHFAGAKENAADSIGGLDLFVLSSHNEGMANVMLEAMAAGVPVIASDISGVRTAVASTEERPSAGWIFIPAKMDSLSQRIVEVVSLIRNGSPEITSRTDEALYRIRNWFSLDRMLDETERILFSA